MKFIDKIAQGFFYDESQVLGYSEEELKKIEDFYLIKVQGDFRDFMLGMGRCSGGLIQSGNMSMYNKNRSVRSHLLQQEQLVIDIGAIGKHEYLGGTFVFSTENEGTINYFFRTRAELSIQKYSGDKALSNDPNRVYCYDENEEKVWDTGLSFIEHMKQEVQYSQKNYQSNEIMKGELIVI